MSYKNMTLIKPNEATYIISNVQFSVARPDESGLEITITKNQFLKAVHQELTVSPYAPVKHNGLRNPYTGKTIASVDDYEEYIREYTFHRLCEEGTLKAYNSRIASEIRHANARYEEARARTRTKYLLVIAALCVALLAAFIYIGSFTKSIKQSDLDSAYQSGYSAGTDAGYTDGYQDGLSSGRTSSYGSSNGASKVQETTVYITVSGTKYHTKYCSYLSESSIPVSLSEAKSEGYDPCSRCNPPR